MPRFAALITIILAVLFVGCGETTEPVPTFEDLSGSYTGTFSSVGNGNTVEGTLDLTIEQESDTLSGEYTFEGTLDDGDRTDEFWGTGSFSGTVQDGEDPAVSIALRWRRCATHPTGHASPFSGEFDSGSGRLTIVGSLDFLGLNCSTVVESYQVSVVLSR